VNEYSLRHLSPLASALITFGIILLIGAFIVYEYTETYSTPPFGTITKHPYRNYAFPFAIIDIACSLAGIAYSIQQKAPQIKEHPLKMENDIKQLSLSSSALIFFGLILLISAFISIRSKYPYDEFSFPLAIIGIASIIIGLLNIRKNISDIK